MVMSNSGPQIVKCVIETQVLSEVELVSFANGLLITKYHPININGKWAFPIQEGRIKKMHVDSYYNFVL